MPPEKSVVITGLRGQDGSILAELLLERGWKVYGLIRRSSQGLDLGNAILLEGKDNLEVVEGDLLDQASMLRLCKLAKPDMVFHCAAMSHVGSSFEQPDLTMKTNSLGTLHMLEAVRLSGIHSRFLHTSTSELFGGLSEEPANETTPFHPRSPYAVSKLAAHYMVINYRESYKMFACNSICFNHEAAGRRGPNFVTRKISLGVAAIEADEQEKLYLGNLDAKRDWGDAWDYCRGMIKILESSKPTEYVLCTGETHSVREFCEEAFKEAGLGDYSKYVEVDPQFYRPAEVNVLIGDSSKMKKNLGWEPTTRFSELVKKMVSYDLGEGVVGSA